MENFISVPLALLMVIASWFITQESATTSPVESGQGNWQTLNEIEIKPFENILSCYLFPNAKTRKDNS